LGRRGAAATDTSGGGGPFGLTGSGVTTTGALVGTIVGMNVGNTSSRTGAAAGAATTGCGGRVGTGVARAPGAFVESNDMTEPLKLM
jgi:hypothetical protein